MIELSFITRDSLNPILTEILHSAKDLKPLKANRTHTVSPVLSFVLLPKVRDLRLEPVQRYRYYEDIRKDSK